MTDIKNYDVIIIGGSYAGLAAAMSLGRALREVLVIDSGNPCNKQTPNSHNFLTRDGETPGKISEIGKEEVLKYPSIEFFAGRATAVTKPEDHFKVQTEENKIFTAKKLIFATGILDIIPEMAGFGECWGISILHCPYCHGYEIRNKQTGVFANGDAGYETTRFISNWTEDLSLYTNGPSTLTPEQSQRLEQKGIKVIEKEIKGFEHKKGMIQNIVFKDETKQPLKALYATPEVKQKSEIPRELGCEFTDHGRIVVDLFQQTTVPGIYAAGDNSSMGRAVSVAVSAGSVAGMMLNKELVKEEFEAIDEVNV